MSKKNDYINILKSMEIILIVLSHVINFKAYIKKIDINNIIY